jgi:O-antigen/teichoic acid export membrane protein
MSDITFLEQKPGGVRSWFPNRERARFWATRIAEFGIWQLAAQVIQLLTGFLLVRWMTVEAYAQYGLALGFQGMLGQLVDLGFSGSIVALVGAQVADREVVGRYVRSALSLRNGFLLIVGPLSGIGFLSIAHQHRWSTVTSVLLFFSIVAYLIFQGWVACYSAPLLMHHEMRRLYAPSVLLNAVKLALCWFVHGCSALGALVVCVLNALSSSATAVLYRSSANDHMAPSIRADSAARREIFGYVTPLLPGMVFYAFQGQIQVFLISLFGQTRSIAEVVALGRLGQIFAFLSSFVGIVIAPYLARVSIDRLGLRYLQVTVLIVAVAGGLSATAFFFSEQVLWVLGPSYAGLSRELRLSVLAASFAFITGALYAFNNARKWVYHWTGVTSIAGLIIIQLIMGALLDLSTTRSVLEMSVVAAAYPIIPFAATAIYGFHSGRKREGRP